MIVLPSAYRMNVTLDRMVVLHATHLLVLHTRNTASSVWVPYEIGRAKQRRLTSTDVAFWHAPIEPPPAKQLPEYAYLVNWVTRDPAPKTMTQIGAWISAI